MVISLPLLLTINFMVISGAGEEDMHGLTGQDLSLIQSQADFSNFQLFLGITEHLFCVIFSIKKPALLFTYHISSHPLVCPLVGWTKYLQLQLLLHVEEELFAVLLPEQPLHQGWLPNQETQRSRCQVLGLRS